MGGGTGCLCSSLTIYLSTLSLSLGLSIYCAAAAAPAAMVFVGVVGACSSIIGTPSRSWDEIWREKIQKVCISFGSKRFSYLWAPKGFRIFGFQKVFVSFGSNRCSYLWLWAPKAKIILNCQQP